MTKPDPVAVAAAHEQLIAALNMYADPESYHAIAFAFDEPCGFFADDFSEDHGHSFYERPMPGRAAREALRTWLDTVTPVSMFDPPTDKTQDDNPDDVNEPEKERFVPEEQYVTNLRVDFNSTRFSSTEEVRVREIVRVVDVDMTAGFALAKIVAVRKMTKPGTETTKIWVGEYEMIRESYVAWDQTIRT